MYFVSPKKETRINVSFFTKVHILPQEGTCSVVVIVVRNGIGDLSYNLGRDYISHSTNTLKKGIQSVMDSKAD